MHVGPTPTYSYNVQLVHSLLKVERRVLSIIGGSNGDFVSLAKVDDHLCERLFLQTHTTQTPDSSFNATEPANTSEAQMPHYALQDFFLNILYLTLFFFD